MTAKLNRVKVPNVVLVGATGSGKTTVASSLAKLLGFGVLDIDARIEQRSKRQIADIFEKDGYNGFRDLESQVIDEVSDILNHVIVTGAGALEREDNITYLKKLGPFIWLATPTKEIVSRLVMKPDELRQRPLLAKAADIEDRDKRAAFLVEIIDNKLKERESAYSEADFTLNSSHATSEINAMLIRKMLFSYGRPKTGADGL